MSRLLAIDPGGNLCGMAYFEQDDAGAWSCVKAWEETPADCCDQIVDWVTDGVTTIVIEEFRLYPWKAKTQSFKTFPEIEVIGVVKWLCRTLADEGLPIECVTQGASIMEPTKNILKAKRVRSLAKAERARIREATGSKTGGKDAIAAELHGYHHILKTRQEEINA